MPPKRSGSSSGEIIITPPQTASWVRWAVGITVTVGGFMGGYIASEARSQAAQETRIVQLEGAMQNRVTREEFAQFSARVIEGQQRIEAELMAMRQDLRKR